MNQLIQPRSGLTTLAILSVMLGAHANDYVVYSPLVVQGQSEVEMRSYADRDPSPALQNMNETDLSVAHAWTSWWKAEAYFWKESNTPGSSLHQLGYEFENTFQLAEEGKFWATPGFLVSYEASGRAGVPDNLELGPLLERQDGLFTQRMNMIWEHEIHPQFTAKPGFRTTYSVSYRYSDPWQPALEAYLRPTDSSYQLGPALYGEIHLGHQGGEMEYQVGWLLGTNRSAPDTTWVARLEYEFF